MNVPRLIHIGMKKLGYSENEILYMTPRKFFMVYDEFLVLNGLQEEEVTIDCVF